MERKGIIAVGNWLCDTVKFIDRYPARGNLVTITRIEQGLGGCAHNVLADLAALQTDLPLYAGGCIGLDAAGDYVMSEIARLGIDNRYMRRTDAAGTSYTDVMSECECGTRTFFHYRGANALLSPNDFDAIDVDAKLFHLGYLLLLDALDQPDAVYGTVAARVLDLMSRKGYKTSVDLVSEESERFRSVVLPCLPYTDYFIVNEIEAGACCQSDLRDADGQIVLSKVAEAARALLDAGVREVCVIHFPEGGYARNRAGEECFVASKRIASSEIVSSVGAGDAFCAGALYALHEGYTLERMLAFANTSARFNLASPTGTSGAPTLAQIEAAL